MEAARFKLSLFFVLSPFGSTDNNAQEAITRLGDMGFKKREAPLPRGTPAKQVPKPPVAEARRPSQAHPPTKADRQKRESPRLHSRPAHISAFAH